MKRLVLTSIIAIAALAAPRVLAQEPSVLLQAPWPLASNPQIAPQPLLLLGEPTGSGSLAPWTASLPLRLSLQSTMFPLSMSGMFPNCESLEGPSGNSFQGIPVQRYTMLSLTPNLVLQGFSSAGCPVDGAIGGGITYSIPIRPSIWLVAGAGFYGVPAHDSLPARRRSDFRVDLVKTTSDGRSMSVGVGRRGVSVGGSF
jgi:hypothetical protein